MALLNQAGKIIHTIGQFAWYLALMKTLKDWITIIVIILYIHVVKLFFFQARGVKLEHDNDLVGPITDGGLEVKVSMDSAGVLCWPVVFVYPEFGETDLISSFDENHRC